MGEVARLRASNAYGGFYYRSSGPGFWTVVTVGGIVVIILYFKGYSWADFMYITKHTFSKAIETLEYGVEELGQALETAKRELSYKMGLVDEKLDHTKESLENKITEEVGDVKRELEGVADDVRAVARGQTNMQG